MVLGIDLGTSSVKVVAVDANGRIAARASRAYALDTPRPGWAEQDPESWWTATADAVREVAKAVGSGEVRAVGFSGQMHTLVLLDDAGRPTRPAISWADARSEAEVRRFAERVDRRTQVEVLGNPVVTGFTGPSLRWVQAHEPDVYAASTRVALAKDYLRLRMTGVWATDVSDASATLLFDPYRRAWATGVVEVLGLDTSMLPPLIGSGEVAGTLHAEAAEALGLPAGLPVVTGASDQAAAACGCGLVDPGAMLVTIGSGGQVFMPLATPVADPRLRVHLFCHAVPERWHLLGAVQNAGLALDWVRRAFGWGWEELYARAAEVPAGAEGVTFLPYLTGERTPHMDPRARASWAGLALSHTPDHLARAAVEGVVFAVAEAVAACAEAGGSVEALAVTGGGAEPALTRQILADVTGRAVRRADVQEASAKGAAVLAGAPMPRFASREAEAPGPTAEAHREALVRARGVYAGWRANFD
ncbi:MAG: xylulokinase [Trueperaceae bacterium]|nr:xylulokinase [Trueperaceae bacterium]